MHVSNKALGRTKIIAKTSFNPTNMLKIVQGMLSTWLNFSSQKFYLFWYTNLSEEIRHEDQGMNVSCTQWAERSIESFHRYNF